MKPQNVSGEVLSPSPLVFCKYIGRNTLTMEESDSAKVLSARIQKFEEEIERARDEEGDACSHSAQSVDHRLPLSLHNPRMQPRQPVSESGLINTRHGSRNDQEELHTSDKAGKLWDDLRSVGLEDVSLLGAIEDACQKCNVFLDADLGPASTAHTLRNGRTFRRGGVECRESSMQTIAASGTAGADEGGEVAAAFSAATVALRSLITGFSVVTSQGDVEKCSLEKRSFHSRLRALAPEARHALLSLVEAACCAEALLRDDGGVENLEVAGHPLPTTHGQWQWHSPSICMDESISMLESRSRESDDWAVDTMRLHEDSAALPAGVPPEVGVLSKCGSSTASSRVGEVHTHLPSCLPEPWLDESRARHAPMRASYCQPRISPSFGVGSLRSVVDAKEFELAELQAKLQAAQSGNTSPEVILHLAAASNELRLLREFAGADNVAAGVNSDPHLSIPLDRGLAATAFTGAWATRHESATREWLR